MKRLLITGASGFLGWNLCRLAKTDWSVSGSFMAHPIGIPGVTMIKADLTRFQDLKGLFRRVKPDAVIHAAAARDPNFCQEHPALSKKINTDCALDIAGLCADRAIPCLFTSSDLVFDGRNPPYSEEDDPAPGSVYGEQKVLAEKGMKERYPGTVICRLPLMFGDPGPASQTFIQPLIRALRSGAEIPLFVDEFRTPVSGEDAAGGIMLAMGHRPDIIHLGGTERISRYGFGELVANMMGIRDPNLRACTQGDLEMAAPRPPDVSLDSSRAGALGFRPDSPAEALRRMRHLL